MEAAFSVTLEEPLGPPSLSTTRLAILQSTPRNATDAVHCVVAAKKKLLHCAIQAGTAPASDVKINAMNGLPFPQKLPQNAHHSRQVSTTFPSAVQSVVAQGELFAAVDARGHARWYQVSTSNPESSTAGEEPPPKKPRVEVEQNMQLRLLYSREPMVQNKPRLWAAGWAGIALSADLTKSAVTHSCGRQSILADTHRPESQNELAVIHHLLTPTACGFLKGGPVGPLHDCFAVSEWNTLTAWDLRCRVGDKPSGNVDFRALGTVNSKAIYSFDVAPDGLTLVCAGVSKELLFVDARKWSIVSKWRCPVK